MEKYLYQDLYELESMHWWHKAKRYTVLSLMKKYLKTKKPKILDIGCGTGKNVEIFSKIGPSFGIDSSRDAITYCKKRGLKYVKLATSEKTSFQKNTFSLITLLDVLEHVDERKTLEEINRVLKKDGFLIITVPAYSFLWSKWDEVLHHKRRYTDKRLEKVLLENNFKVIFSTYLYSFLLIPAFLIRSIKERFSNNNYSSDFKLSNALINFILFNISKMESKFALKIPLPFGTSIICIAQKND